MIGNYLLLCLIGMWAYLIPNTVGREAIYGGTLVQRAEQFPYMVGLLFPLRDLNCGGGILNDNFVITAAHCVVDISGRIVNKPLSVVAGTVNVNHYTQYPAVIVKVKRIFAPREYDSSFDASDDIAVLQLKDYLGLEYNTHLHRLKLPHHNEHGIYETYNGKIAVMAGFGMSDRGLQSGQLRFAETVILREGEKGYHGHELVQDSSKQICARAQQHDSKSAKRRGMNAGDDGGPLVYNETVIGILSIFIPNERDMCSVYTRVSPYVNFIKNTMNYYPNKHHSNHINTVELLE